MYHLQFTNDLGNVLIKKIMFLIAPICYTIGCQLTISQIVNATTPKSYDMNLLFLYFF